MAISYNTTPNEKRSVRGSSSSALICSGDMYAMVPRVEPASVRRSAVVSPLHWSVLVVISIDPVPASERLANPKSRILACPRSVTKMFAGLMSR